MQGTMGGGRAIHHELLVSGGIMADEDNRPILHQVITQLNADVPEKLAEGLRALRSEATRLSQPDADADENVFVDYVGGSPLMQELLTIWDKEKERETKVSLALMKLIVEMCNACASNSPAVASIKARVHAFAQRITRTRGRLLISLLGSGKMRLETLCLRLLAAMVRLGSTMARDVARCVPFTCKPLDDILKSPRPMLKREKKKAEAGTLKHDITRDPRSAAIDLLTAYVLSADTPLIIVMIETKGFLGAPFKHIGTDPAPTVKRFVQALHQRLVRTSAVPRGLKSSFFNGFELDRLATVFDSPDEELRTSVAEILTDLCCHWKFGLIVGDNAGSLGPKQPSGAGKHGTVLDFLSKLHPCDDPLQRTLVRDALSSHPEMQSTYLSRMPIGLQPKKSHRFLATLGFISDLLSLSPPPKLVHPAPPAPSATGMTAARHVSILADWCVPPCVAQGSILTQTLQSSSGLLRICGLVTLVRTLERLALTLKRLQAYAEEAAPSTSGSGSRRRAIDWDGSTDTRDIDVDGQGHHSTGGGAYGWTSLAAALTTEVRERLPDVHVIMRLRFDATTTTSAGSTSKNQDTESMDIGPDGAGKNDTDVVDVGESAAARTSLIRARSMQCVSLFFQCFPMAVAEVRLDVAKLFEEEASQGTNESLCHALELVAAGGAGKWFGAEGKKAQSSPWAMLLGLAASDSKKNSRMSSGLRDGVVAAAASVLVQSGALGSTTPNATATTSSEPKNDTSAHSATAASAWLSLLSSNGLSIMCAGALAASRAQFVLAEKAADWVEAVANTVVCSDSASRPPLTTSTAAPTPLSVAVLECLSNEDFVDAQAYVAAVCSTHVLTSTISAAGMAHGIQSSLSDDMLMKRPAMARVVKLCSAVAAQSPLWTIDVDSKSKSKDSSDKALGKAVKKNDASAVCAALVVASADEIKTQLQSLVSMELNDCEKGSLLSVSGPLSTALMTRTDLRFLATISNNVGGEQSESESSDDDVASAEVSDRLRAMPGVDSSHRLLLQHLPFQTLLVNAECSGAHVLASKAVSKALGNKAFGLPSSEMLPATQHVLGVIARVVGEACRSGKGDTSQAETLGAAIDSLFSVALSLFEAAIANNGESASTVGTSVLATILTHPTVAWCHLREGASTTTSIAFAAVTAGAAHIVVHGLAAAANGSLSNGATLSAALPIVENTIVALEQAVSGASMTADETPRKKSKSDKGSKPGLREEDRTLLLKRAEDAGHVLVLFAPLAPSNMIGRAVTHLLHTVAQIGSQGESEDRANWIKLCLGLVLRLTNGKHVGTSASAGVERRAALLGVSTLSSTLPLHMLGSQQDQLLAGLLSGMNDLAANAPLPSTMVVSRTAPVSSALVDGWSSRGGMDAMCLGQDDVSVYQQVVTATASPSVSAGRAASQLARNSAAGRAAGIAMVEALIAAGPSVIAVMPVAAAMILRSVVEGDVDAAACGVTSAGARAARVAEQLGSALVDIIVKGSMQDDKSGKRKSRHDDADSDGDDIEGDAQTFSSEMGSAVTGILLALLRCPEAVPPLKVLRRVVEHWSGGHSMPGCPRWALLGAEGAANAIIAASPEGSDVQGHVLAGCLRRLCGDNGGLTDAKENTDSVDEDSDAIGVDGVVAVDAISLETQGLTRQDMHECIARSSISAWDAASGAAVGVEKCGGAELIETYAKAALRSGLRHGDAAGLRTLTIVIRIMLRGCAGPMVDPATCFALLTGHSKFLRRLMEGQGPVPNAPTLVPLVWGSDDLENTASSVTLETASIVKDADEPDTATPQAVALRGELLSLMVTLMEADASSCASASIQRTLMAAYGATLCPHDRTIMRMLTLCAGVGFPPESLHYRFGSAQLAIASNTWGGYDWALEEGGLQSHRLNASASRLPLTVTQPPPTAELPPLPPLSIGDEHEGSFGVPAWAGGCFDPTFVLPLLQQVIALLDGRGVRRCVDAGALPFALHCMAVADDHIRGDAYAVVEAVTEKLEAAAAAAVAAAAAAAERAEQAAARADARASEGAGGDAPINEAVMPGAPAAAERRVSKRLGDDASPLLMLMRALREAVEEPLQLLPALTVDFAAQAATVAQRPSHPLYAQVCKYLLRSPSLDVTDMPMFGALMHGFGPTHRAERLWLLRLLRNGPRCQADLPIFRRRRVMEHLCMLYDAPGSDPMVRSAVLQALCACGEHSAPSAHVVGSHAGLVWLRLLAAGSARNTARGHAAATGGQGAPAAAGGNDESDSEAEEQLQDGTGDTKKADAGQKGSVGQKRSVRDTNPVHAASAIGLRLCNALLGTTTGKSVSAEIGLLSAEVWAARAGWAASAVSVESDVRLLEALQLTHAALRALPNNNHNSPAFVSGETLSELIATVTSRRRRRSKQHTTDASPSLVASKQVLDTIDATTVSIVANTPIDWARRGHDGDEQSGLAFFCSALRWALRVAWPTSLQNTHVYWSPEPCTQASVATLFAVLRWVATAVNSSPSIRSCLLHGHSVWLKSMSGESDATTTQEPSMGLLSSLSYLYRCAPDVTTAGQLRIRLNAIFIPLLLHSVRQTPTLAPIDGSIWQELIRADASSVKRSKSKHADGAGSDEEGSGSKGDTPAARMPVVGALGAVIDALPHVATMSSGILHAMKVKGPGSGMVLAERWMHLIVAGAVREWLGGGDGSCTVAAIHEGMSSTVDEVSAIAKSSVDVNAQRSGAGGKRKTDAKGTSAKKARIAKEETTIGSMAEGDDDSDGGDSEDTDKKQVKKKKKKKDKKKSK